VIGEPNQYALFAPHVTTAPEGTRVEVPVFLDAAIDPPATATVDFVVSSAAATEGTDYTPAGGTVTFPPGSTSAMIAVDLLTDLDLEGPELVTITLTNAVGTVLSDDAFASCLITDPGHFAWTLTGGPGLGSPFMVTVTASDTNGATLTSFTGTVAVSASSEVQTNKTMLGSPTATWHSSGPVPVTQGLRITPTHDIAVNALRYFWGNKVSIWMTAAPFSPTGPGPQVQVPGRRLP